MSAPDDTPLFAVVIEDTNEWYEFDLDAWTELELLSEQPEVEDYD